MYWTNGTDKTLDVELDPSLVALEPTSAIGAAGVYTFNVSADADAVAAGNIVFSSSDAFTVNATKADAFASFSYNGAALEDSYDIFPGQSFNINAVTASYNGTQLGVSSSTSDFKIVDGYANTTVPGEYKVTFEYIGGSPVSGVSTALNGKYVARLQDGYHPRLGQAPSTPIPSSGSTAPIRPPLRSTPTARPMTAGPLYAFQFHGDQQGRFREHRRYGRQALRQALRR